MSQERRKDDDLTQMNPVAPGGAVGRAPITARLSPRPIVFRVESAEAARELGSAFGRRDANGVAAGADVAVQRAASSSGSPLPASVKDRFESSLGADLSGVRVHTGSASADAASAVGARAFTTGQDIHFGAGQYAPADPFGMHLLAHEVAHTVQQSGGAPTTQYKLEVSTPGDAAELEADRAADAMVAGQRASVSGARGVARATILRKEGAPASEFGANGGSAGVMDTMATKAGQNVKNGLPPVVIPTEHAPKVAAFLEDGAAQIANMKVPGSAGTVGMDNPAVQQWQAESARFLLDGNYISVTQEAYDGAIDPTVVAAKGFAQVKSIAHDSLSLVDDHALADASVKADQIQNQAYKDVGELGADMTAAQKKALGEVLTKESQDNTGSILAGIETNIAGAQSDVVKYRSDLTTGALGVQQAILKKLQAKLAERAKAKQEDKDKITEEINKISEAAEHVATIAKVATSVATGGIGAIEGGDVKEAKDAAKDLGLPTDAGAFAETGGSLFAAAVTSFAKAHFEGELNKLDNAIKTASNGIQEAKDAGVVLGDLKSDLDQHATAKALVDAKQRWCFYLNQRKHYLAVSAKKADQAVSKGDKNKDSISQVAVLLSASREARGYLDAAKESVGGASTVIGTTSAKILGHRGEGLPLVSTTSDGYVVTKENGWHDTNAPDTRAIYTMEGNLASWAKDAGRQLVYLDEIDAQIAKLASGK